MVMRVVYIFLGFSMLAKGLCWETDRKQVGVGPQAQRVLLSGRNIGHRPCQHTKA